MPVGGTIETGREDFLTKARRRAGMAGTACGFWAMITTGSPGNNGA